MFTSIEYLKQKENPRIAIVHLFEKKHGFGIAFKQRVKNAFGKKIWSCMKKVITFVTDDDIYTVTSKHQIKSKVRLLHARTGCEFNTNRLRLGTQRNTPGKQIQLFPSEPNLKCIQFIHPV